MPKLSSVDIHVPLATRLTIRESDVKRHKLVSPGNSRLATLGIAAWVGLLADSPVLSRDKKRLFNRAVSFRNDVMKRPLADTVTFFSSLCDRLLANLTVTDSGSSTGPFISEFRNTPVFQEYLIFTRTQESNLLRWLISFLWFLKKLKIDDPAMHATSLRGWYDCEVKLNQLELPQDTLRSLSVILKALLPNPNWADFWPRYGPGKVAEERVKGVVDKSSNVTYDEKIDRVFFRFKRVPKTAFLPDVDLWESGRPASLSEDDISRVSIMRPVFKDVRKSRTICKEPNTLMYFQQGVMNMLNAATSRSLLGRFVDYADQSLNRDLAAYGSQFQSHDTIDLSNASDLVSWDVVKAIFPSSWLVLFAATRSTRVLVDEKDLVRVKKFAPMGSALCFPVESLLFLSVCLLEVLRHRNVDVSSLDVKAVRAELTSYLGSGTYKTDGEIRVYGDDIITPCEITDGVISTLTSLGLEVNTRKSFMGQQLFRESCGGYYFGGADVTPVLFKVKPFEPDGSWNASSYVSVVEHANLIGDYHYRVTRSVLIHFLRDNTCSDGSRLKIPFTQNERAFGILTKSDVTRREKTKLDKLHRMAMRAHVIEAPVERGVITVRGGNYTIISDEQDERVSAYAMMRYWSSRIWEDRDGQVDNPTDRDLEWSPFLPERGVTRIRWGWIPVE